MSSVNEIKPSINLNNDDDDDDDNNNNKNNNMAIASSNLTYKAFISYDGVESTTIIKMLHEELCRYGIHPERHVLFYDDYMQRHGGEGTDDKLIESRLKTWLLASEYLILFLTPGLLTKKWALLVVLRLFFKMMESDKRRKLIPVFYMVSAKEFENIIRKNVRLNQNIGLDRKDGEQLRSVLEKMKYHVGIDAKGLNLSGIDIVKKILKDVFATCISDDRRNVNVRFEDHDVSACSNQLCDHPICVDRVKSSLVEFFAVPPLPNYTILKFENPQRPENMLRHKLLSDASKVIAAVGVKAMGGVGKTTRLIGVVNDPQVRKAFPDGVFWIQISARTIVEEMRGIFVKILKWARYHWKQVIPKVIWSPRTSLDEIATITGEALKEKRCLFVFDDYYPFHGYESSIARFMRILNRSSRILLSTQHRGVVNAFHADQIDVGYLDQETACALFDNWCGATTAGQEEENLKKEILSICSNVALAVCIAGSNVKRIASSEGKKGGLTRVREDLQRNLGILQQLAHIRSDHILNAVIHTSINSITDEGYKNGYRRLAVFNNQTRIPNQALEVLWRTDTASVAACVDLYVACSLATRRVIAESGSAGSFYVEFHDQHLEYARYIWHCANDGSNAGSRGRSCKAEGDVGGLDAHLLDGYKSMCDEVNARVWWEAELLDDGYFHENFARHLMRSGKVAELLEVVMDYRWIALRCRRQEIAGLLRDFDLALSGLEACQEGEGQVSFAGLWTEANESNATAKTDSMCESACYALRLVREAVRAGQTSLWEGRDEVPFQLVGRLLAHSSESPFVKKLIDSARRWERRPWLCPVTQCFESPLAGPFRALSSDSVVHSVAVLHEIRHLVACGTADGHVHLWDWNAGCIVWSQKGHESRVSSLAATKDGNLMVSGSWDKVVRLWDVESGKCRKVLRGHNYGVSSVAVTANGSAVVSGSDDFTVRLWNMESGDCKSVLRGHESCVDSVAVAEGRSVVASGSCDKTVRLWNMESGECAGVLRGHESWVTSLALTRDGSLVVSGSYDNTIRLWNTDSGKCLRVLRGHQDWVRSLAVRKDGSVVVSGSWDNTVRLWNVRSGKCAIVLRGHDSAVNSVATTEDGSIVVSGSRDKKVRLWKVRSGEHMSALRGYECGVKSVAVTEDGSLLASLSCDSTVRLCNAGGREGASRCRGHELGVTSLAVTRDGNIVASLSGDKRAQLWNVESTECKSVLRGHAWGVTSLALTEDGSVVVSGSYDKTVRLWDVESGKCKGVLRGHEDLVTSVAVSKDGSVVVSGSYDKTVRLWNAESGECKNVLRGHHWGVTSVAMTGDGSVLVSGSVDCTVRLWDVERGGCKGVLLGHKCGVSSVAVSENGNSVVSASDNFSVRLWNAQSGECKRMLRRQEYGVRSVALTEDGSTVVTLSGGKTVRSWNVDNGECLKTVYLHTNYHIIFGSRDLLRLAQSVGLLTTYGEAGFNGPSSWSLPGESAMKVEAGVVRVVRNERARTLMSATFDITDLSALSVNLKGHQRVVVFGNNMFILKIIDPKKLEKEFGPVDRGSGRS